LFLGGWTLDGVQTIFNYIVGSPTSDAYVGRIQSAWPNPNEGGVCPDIESFPPNERVLFQLWSLNLLGATPITDVTAVHCIACVLLLHYRATLQYMHNHRLNVRMQECIQQCGEQTQKLLEWCDLVKAHFDRENGLFLPLDQLEEDAVIPVRDVHEFMQRSEEQHAYQARELQRVSRDLSDLKGR
jgi:hypothetical protein